MTTRVALLGVAALLVVSSTAFAADNLISGKTSVVKGAKLSKFVSKSSTGFPLPVAGGAEDPTLNGAQIRMFDRVLNGGAGDFLHSLPAAGWSTLGNPPGSKGYKYKGSAAGDLICKVVLIKEKVIKAVCKSTTLPLAPPFLGNEGIILGVPTDTSGAAIRYCAEFGGTEKKNDTKTFKHKDAPAPAGCPFTLPTPTVTNTPTVTDTVTATATATVTATATSTATATDTGTATATATATSTRTASATATFTATLTQTPTDTPTSTPTSTPDYVFHKCVLDTANCAPATDPLCGSFIQIYIAALGPVPLKFGLSGAIDIAGGLVPLGGGLTSAACDIQALDPVNIPSIGFVCIQPSAGCPVGTRDCDGGTPLGVEIESDGNIGACTSNAQCVTQCDAFCPSQVGAPYAQFNSSCTGYCTTGAQQACTTDAQCVGLGQGACNGPDPVPPNADICQCSCIDATAHGPSDSGDLLCNLGSNLVVESAAPCDGTDVLIPVGQTCIPLSTQEAKSKITDANFVGGSQVPASPAVNDLTGLNVSCPTLDSSTTTGLGAVGTVNFFGSALGDLAVGIKSTCQ